MAQAGAPFEPPCKKAYNYSPNVQDHRVCSVPGCHENGFTSLQLSYSFPSDKTKRKKWIHAIHRDPGPTFTVSFIRGNEFRLN